MQKEMQRPDKATNLTGELPPLAVDLDGTLTKADTLHEGFIGCFRAAPRDVLRLRHALRKGKAAFKREVAGRVPFDPSLLPYNDEVLAYLREEKQAGRRIGLFTAADQSIADAVAEHVGLFDVARGSDGVTNLSGEAKTVAIREVFGDRFAYAGNADVDQPIFAEAEKAVLVGPVERLRKGLARPDAVEAVFPQGQADLRVWLKALRVSHWVKNALIFVAPILGFQMGSPLVAAEALLLFVLMGVVASATYLINDMMDLPADRQHPRKRFRPFASGAIPVRDGCIAAAALLTGAFAASLLLPAASTAALLTYLVVTLAYSFVLKRQPIVDVFVLAGLFTLRVWAGSTVMPVAPSPWLFSFSMMFFLGLAMVKRYAELDRVLNTGGTGVVSRGYTAKDLPLLLAAGIGASFAAIVIFTIYLINEHYPLGIYTNPALLWGMMPIILIWTLRVWHLTVHGKMDEDPVVFALKDRLSLALGALAGALLFAAWW
ncbi:MAG TPA: UbiA family prenyltransferase [Microvirga sp.]|jgi:4-hydroxybenzoate polyprenyltransferase/phosphoserine phosphatase